MRCCARIIPARAGFTSTTRRPSSRGSDHPRSRGVYPDRRFVGRVGEGSSPLARGLQLRVEPVCEGAGIIPARAGFTLRVGPSDGDVPDHPRSRGVYLREMARDPRVSGSSPLARGLRRGARGALRNQGIIPARAGFTPSRTRGRTFTADHPRSRGGYVTGGLVVALNRGSSPLARGLRVPVRDLRHGGGIIPARAGFTRARSST